MIVKNIMNDKKLPTFSVILPIYNVEKFLKDALDSLKNQTFGDFEAICVNDASTDNSLKLLEDFARYDERFRVFDQVNKGQGITRNESTLIAKGKYVLYLDPDDFYDLDLLQKINDAFLKFDVDIVQFDYVTAEEFSGKTIEKKVFREMFKEKFSLDLKTNTPYSWSEISDTRLPLVSTCVWDKAYKRDFLIDNNIKCGTTRVGQDLILAISSVLKAQKIVYIENAFYHYRMRKSSVVHTLLNNIFEIFEDLDDIKNFLIKEKLFEKFKEDFLEFSLNTFSFNYVRVPLDIQNDYCLKVEDYLDNDRFKRFNKIVNGNLSLIERILSFTNRTIANQRYKIIRLLFWEFKIKINH